MQNHKTPKKLLVITIVSVFIAEALIMLILSTLPQLSTWTTTLFDAALIIISIAPVLYFFLFRPLQQSLIEKTQSEELFKKEELKFRLLANHTNDWEYWLDPDGNYIYLSPSCQRITGYTPKEFRENPELLFSIVEPEFSEKVINHYAESNNKNTPACTIDFPILSKNGKKVWIEHNCLSVFDEQENFIGRLGNNRDITNNKKAKEALLESEEKYRLIFETAANLITSVNSNGIIVDCNNKIEEVLGYTKEEIIGQSYTKIIHPDYHKHSEDTIKQLITTGIIQRKEYKMIRKDGRVIDIQMNSSCIKDNQGNFVRSICIIDDITHKKLAIENLKKSEQKFKDMFDNNNAVKLVIDPSSGSIVEANSSACKFYKYTQDEITSLKIWDINVLTKDEIKEKMSNTLNMKKIDHEFQHRLADGEIRDVQVFSGPMTINGTDLLHSIIIDITDRKKSEAANNRLTRAIEQADETIVITDTKGTIEYVNPAFQKTTGYTVEEAIGLNPNVLKSGLHDDNFYKTMWDTLASGKQWQGEITNKKKDGTLYTEHATISPVYNQQGEIVNFVAAKNDITETKRLQELESRASRLEMAGTIAGQVAHDFNNLLAPIMAYPEFIREELAPDSHAHTYLNTIEESAKKIADINQDLLTMGRRGHYNQEIININNIINHAVKEMNSRTESITCTTDLSNELLNIKGGSAQIHRMITNLLVNAKDAMDNNGIIIIKTENYYSDETTIEYGCVPKGEYVKLTITDHGCGIPQNISEKILDPFFSTKNANKRSGSGLGLSVVDSVIKDHNGFLDLHSEVGKGTSFYIYFPITREDCKNVDLNILKGGSESILIVDDDFVLREVSTQILKKLGYKVSSEINGENAIEFLKENPQDLVLLDMIMSPGIDGTETYKQILKINPYQKALLVSGFSESLRVKTALKLGVGAFLRKPFTKFSLASAVRKELDRQVEVLQPNI